MSATAQEVSGTAAKISKSATANAPIRRPDLNGVRMQTPGEDTQYLILDGYKCQIPDPWTEQSLFVGVPIEPDVDLDEIVTGTDLAKRAVLARGTSGGIYLISYPPAPGSTTLVKMNITQPNNFKSYQFNEAKVVQLPQVVIEAIPTGSPVPPASPLAEA
jgi:hypothetical protein